MGQGFYGRKRLIRERTHNLNYIDVLNSHEYKKADIYPESREAPETSVVAGWSGGTIPIGFKDL